MCSICWQRGLNFFEELEEVKKTYEMVLLSLMDIMVFRERIVKDAGDPEDFYYQEPFFIGHSSYVRSYYKAQESSFDITRLGHVRLGQIFYDLTSNTDYYDPQTNGSDRIIVYASRAVLISYLVNGLVDFSGYDKDKDLGLDLDQKIIFCPVCYHITRSSERYKGYNDTKCYAPFTKVDCVGGRDYE